MLTHPWTRPDLYLWWVGWDWNLLYCSHHNLESSDDESVGTLSVLDADWSVITKYRGVFDIMNIDELSSSVKLLLATRSSAMRGHRPTSHINPSCQWDFYVRVSIYVLHSVPNNSDSSTHDNDNGGNNLVAGHSSSLWPAVHLLPPLHRHQPADLKNADNSNSLITFIQRYSLLLSRLTGLLSLVILNKWL